MSPARIRHDGPEIDFHQMVRRILLDVAPLKWFGPTGGRGVAVLNAIVHSRRDRANWDWLVLDFLERHCIGQQ